MSNALKLYALGGALTLAWNAERAHAQKPVWPGILGSDGKPPGALVAFVETLALWPLAALHNFAPPRNAAVTAPDAPPAPVAPTPADSTGLPW